MSAQNDPFYNQFFKNNADEKIQYDENGNPIDPNVAPVPAQKPGGLGSIMPGIESMAVKQAPGQIAEAAGLSSIGAGPMALIAAQAALSGNAALSELNGKKPDLLSRGALDLSTFGLNELALPFLAHESTKELEAKKWKGIANSTDPANAAYGKQYQQYLASPQAKIDATGPNTFDAKKAAGTLKPEDVWGGAGLVNDIPGWLTKYTGDQRKNISQQLLDSNLITSDHGDLELTDIDKANALAQGALSGKQNAPIVSTQPASIQGNPPLSSVAPPGLIGPITQLDPAVQGQIAQLQKQTKLSAIQPYLKTGNANFNNFGNSFKGF